MIAKLPDAILQVLLDGQATRIAARMREVVVFEGPDAYAKAERAANEHGLTSGSLQAGAPTGLYAGADYVSKWRGLSGSDRVLLDGMIVHPARRPDAVAVLMTEKPLAEYAALAFGDQEER